MLYGVTGVLRGYSLEHERGEQLEPLLQAYRDVVNRVLEELWGHIEWEKRKVKGGKKQWRLKPKYKVDMHSGEYKEGAQGPPPPRVALRRPQGGLRHKNSLLHTQILEEKLC